MMPSLYFKIKKDKTIKKQFETIFDFYIINEINNTKDYLFYANHQLTIFATDGAGGVYAFKAEDNIIGKSSIVFVSSEGTAGMIATSFNELVNLIVHFPFWQDILNFSNDGSYSQMVKVAKVLEDERIKCVSNYKETQLDIIRTLKLTENRNILKILLENVIQKPMFRVYSTQDGHPSDCLIGDMKLQSL